ncbi:MAG: histidine--tRNA ligase [Burkholderiales bacterium]
MSSELRAVRGMNDVLPDEAARWEALEETLRSWLRSYGYRNIRTPIVEPTALFQRAIGEATDIVEKEMYSFEDSLNGEKLTLRPEATASTVRACLEHSLLYGGPQRVYYMGPMFRHERPQKGRYRQFHQVGAEALGYPGPDVDAEMLLMCHRLWKMLGLGEIKLEINSLGNSEERKLHRGALIKYLESHERDLDDDGRRRMHSNPLRVLDTKNPHMQAIVEAAPTLSNYLGELSLKHFEGVQKVLNDAAIAYRINPRLVRGLDYYNLTVFEWVTDKLGAQGTVCGGGRYDGLFEQLGGKPQPACGWAMGMERLLALLELEDNKPTKSPIDVYLVNQGEAAGYAAIRIAESLRDAGVRVSLHAGGGSFKSQMKRADASGASLAIIIGDDEVAAGEVAIKPLRIAREQIRVKEDSLSAITLEILKESELQ